MKTIPIKATTTRVRITRGVNHVRVRDLMRNGVGTLTHPLPHVSNDNPYSEPQFKTLKYHPSFPERFDSIEHSRMHCVDFFPWYNDEHRHSGIGMLTSHDVHYGFAELRHAHRPVVLETAYAAHPERFVRQVPAPPALPMAAWINKPINSLKLVSLIDANAL